MKLATSTYIAADSSVHACDARVKIVLLFVFTVTVFFADTWPGMGLFSAATLAVLVASRVPLGRYFGVLSSVYVLMAFSVLFNAVAWSGGVSDAVFAAGPLAVSAGGFVRGCFFALRILLLCLGSMAVCFTTTTTALAAAFGWMLGPLRALRFPVDDAVTVLSIALRFIPLLVAEVERVRDARWARGARFDGGLADKLGAWGNVFVAVFVGLFRRADRLAFAMDARCYGLPGVAQTETGVARCGAASAVALVAGVALLVAGALLL